MSAQASASQMRTSHAYVQQVRNSMAESVLQRQSVVLKQHLGLAGDSAYTISQVAFDETEMDLCINGNDAQTRSLLLMHCKLLCRTTADTKIEELPVVPAILEETITDRCIILHVLKP